ncbi:unnamed protein product [Bursaphelenchus xylophilus]|uniref:(pine wood nematode) hypothetical protein n=1 Tax=Bursaphelenchus xylophilus TaxID=6326 RepID=A0A1I7RXF2_BURXY|nr:unnamed protein product [Bursaphelenchus xylophilus]CAG9126353.1 unnamed protein product [Bursaphelenchus xylophilus]
MRNSQRCSKKKGFLSPSLLILHALSSKNIAEYLGSCGFHTHAMEGEIVSPGYPDVDYPNYASCLWEISVPPGFHVKLNFDRLDIAKSAGCLKDYLAVYQEHQSRGKDPMRNYLFYFDHDELVKRICGIDAIAPIETESRRVRLNFTTNNDITARGFRLTWEAKCGTVFQLNHGEVMSPFYPSYYPNEDMECIYQINPPTKYTQIVTIRIDDLELDDTLVDGKRKPCGSDYVQIIDVAANRVAFTACGRNNEEAGFSPISIKGPVAVRFVSNTTFFQDNKRKRMRGFHLTYALSDCGGEIVLDEETSHMTGTITSPSFPLPYHHKLNCVWNVTAPDGYVIAAKFRQMDIEGSEQCYFDYIELWDGVEATNTTTWGRICGQTPPFGTKMTKTNNMLIQFHTDETTSKGGFSLVLTATLGPEKGCGGEIRADAEWRTIQPPLSKGEEMDTYMNNLRCWWRISADKGSVIEFKLSDVDLEQRRVMGNGSCYDFLAIYDGPQGISPWLLRPSCLAKDFDQEHLHYYSSYKKADVYFETDSSDAFGGFTLQFRAIEPDCGGVYTAKAGEDQLLVYNSQRTLTRTHQRYKRCRFFIRGEENEPIELSMNSFSFPTKTAKCDEEFFEVSDVGTVAECQHPACATEQKDAQNIYRTCGSNVFWRFVSKTSLVQIVTSVVLQSQFTSSFNLTYTLLDSCNRTITVDDPYSRFASGRVHSPNFPYQYDANSTCITRIKVPDEYRILLVFKQFMIERGAYTLRRNPYWRRIQGEPGSRGIPRLYSKRQVGQFRGIGGQMTSFGGISKFFDDNCKFDALRVTYNMTGNLTKTLCGFATPPPVLTAQNQMVLNFTSDASSNHGGFDANYYLIKTYQQEYQKLYEYAPIYEKSGVVVNLGFPGYSVNTTYRAFVLPPRGMTCEMSITRYLNKDPVTCNNGDVLKVATVTDDGTHWTEIECASEMSVRKISAGLVQKEIQSFKIEFNTDSDAANDGRGFMATWDCSEAVTEVLVTDQWDTKIVT